MWPTKQLTEGHRYIVAMRNLRTNANQPVNPSAAFITLRDGILSGDPDAENRRELFKEPGLQGDLDLAWDFTVGSEKATTGAMFFMRDDAVSRIPVDGPIYEITNVEENASERILRKITGQMMIPHYMTNNSEPGCSIFLDEDGIPVYQGEVGVRFTVPKKVDIH